MKINKLFWLVIGGFFLAGCGYFKQPAIGPLIENDEKNVGLPAAPTEKVAVTAPQENQVKLLGLKNEDGNVVMYVLKNNEKNKIVLYPREKIPRTLAFLKKHQDRLISVIYNAEHKVSEIKSVDSQVNPLLELSEGK